MVARINLDSLSKMMVKNEIGTVVVEVLFMNLTVLYFLWWVGLWIGEFKMDCCHYKNLHEL